MATLPKLISKTKIMQGYQCQKNIYLSVHRKDLVPKVGPELQALFDQGNAVTIEARKRFSNGVLVDLPAYDFFGSLKKTRELLAAHTPVIFEAAFEYQGCYARADVITYNEVTQRWSIIEVKSTTKVKDEHLDDVGLQVCRSKKFRSCILIHFASIPIFRIYLPRSRLPKNYVHGIPQFQPN